MLEFKLHLLLNGGHPPGQQPAQPKLIPFRGGERGILVQGRLLEYARAEQLRRRRPGDGRVRSGGQLAALSFAFMSPPEPAN